MKLTKNYKLKNEHQSYPELKKYFEKKGYMYTRIEGNPSVPDIFLNRGKDWYWTEVKIFRGKKDLFAEDLSADDLSWQPGQLRFRKDMIDAGNENNYLLVVLTPEWDFRFIIGGLDRCS